MLYFIGGVPIELTLLAAGIRGGVLPPGPPLLDPAGNNSVELTPEERADLRAFQSTGWQFLASPDLDWAAVRDLNPGLHLFAGVLARQEGGGLVVVRDRLVISLAGHDNQNAVLVRYLQVWPLGAGRFEVQVPLPNQGLQLRIDDELAILAGKGVPAELSLLYHLGSPGEINCDVDTAPQWQWDAIYLEKAWVAAGGHQGAGIRPAIIDLGFYLPDEVLWKTAWTARLSEDGIYLGPDVPADEHGTFCAALIGGLSDGYNVNGVVPESELILVAIPKEGVISQVGLKRAIELCFTGRDENGVERGAGADVISCSLSAPSPIWPLTGPLLDAIGMALRKGRGNLGTPIVWATRNIDALMQEKTVQAYPRLLTVSASNEDGDRVESEYGPGLDLIAPGIAVGGMSWNGDADFGYALGYGSSYATACAAGVAALIVAVRPDLGWERVVDLVQDNADRTNGWTPSVGWGRLNALASVKAALIAKP